MKRPVPLLVLACALVSATSASEAATYVVDRVTDANPGGGGEGSGLAGDLRFCLGGARSGDSVVFDVVGTIALNAALPTLAFDIEVQGPGANVLTIDGAGGSVLNVAGGTTVSISGLTVTGGATNGGGILNQGALTLENAVIRDNTAGDPTNGGGTGAGIWNYVNATLTLTGCTVSGNTAIGNLSYAPSRGAGVANYGALTLINSTVSGNSASQGFGGGISNSLPTSLLTLVNSTVSDNATPGTSGTGGVENLGVLTAGNSIVAGNADGDLFGDVDSDGYNIFGTTNGAGFDPTDLLGVDPLLGPLQDNGGPTWTMAPLAGSSALDRIPGTPGVDFPVTDQRGVSRPQAAKADTGAVEAGDAPGFQVTGVAPHSGTALGGTPITIAGIGFLQGASVKIGGVLAVDIVVLSTSEIHATTPSLSPGTLNDVLVTNPASVPSSPLVSALLPEGWLADFVDVPQGDLFQPFVESLVRGGITAGCGAGAYCRNDPVARQQMAVFLLKAEHGSAYVPPACQGVFQDVSCPGPFTDWIEELLAEGITGGCGADEFCPGNPVTRAQMSSFLLKTEHGSAYTPPACTGIFGDVSCPALFADWIERLYAEGVTGGCAESPLLYCPAANVTRGQMAVFLVKTFDLP